LSDHKWPDDQDACAKEMARLNKQGIRVAMSKTKIDNDIWVHIWVPDKPQLSTRQMDVQATKAAGPINVSGRKPRIK
jgi:hypothetical protein